MTRFRSSHMVAALGALLATSCGGAAPGTRPDDMSAADHHAQATRHRQAAEEHMAQYDPTATRTRTLNTAGGEDRDVTYNPTEEHQQQAEQEREIARQHLEAARELERFEQAECGPIPPAERPACPLLGAVTEARDIDGGVRVTLRDAASRDAVLAHMRCHAAFARTNAREGMAQCPLYLEGVSVEPGSGAGTVDLTAEHHVDALRRRTKSHVGS